jgi:hypothetical protein
MTHLPREALDSLERACTGVPKEGISSVAALFLAGQTCKNPAAGSTAAAT